MDDLRKFAESAGIDNLDQTFHALVQRARILDARRFAGAALRAMFGRPAFGDIDRFAREECTDFCGEVDVFR